MAAAGPIILIGLGLMFYNALRFDNPFEFGWRYQLSGDRDRIRFTLSACIISGFISGSSFWSRPLEQSVSLRP